MNALISGTEVNALTSRFALMCCFVNISTLGSNNTCMISAIGTSVGRGRRCLPYIRTMSRSITGLVSVLSLFSRYVSTSSIPSLIEVCHELSLWKHSGSSIIQLMISSRQRRSSLSVRHREWTPGTVFCRCS